MQGRFDYVAYDETAKAEQAEAKAKCLDLEKLIESLGSGRSTAVALTKLEECYAWIGKAIRDKQIAQRGANLEEQRSNS